jgi:hypothetical protein
MINGKEIPMCKHCNGLTFEKGGREKRNTFSKAGKEKFTRFLVREEMEWNGKGKGIHALTDKQRDIPLCAACFMLLVHGMALIEF